MPDGGTKEDFPHIANTLDTLIQQHKIPEIILVGIENTKRGRDLTGESKIKEHEQYNIPMTDGAKNFRAFIKNELIPEINKRYKTNNEKGIIGESLAGLFVMETFFKQPSLFDFYIAMDPSLWWNNNYLVNNAKQFLENYPEKDTKIWFAGSNAQDIQKYTRELASFLEHNSTTNLTWNYSDQPNEKHNTIYRATKAKALIWSLNKTGQ
jgi:predicted alpha/beta superfamily hydrolase